MTNFLDRLSSHWFAWAVPASWQLAVFVCLVAIIAWVATAASPRLRYGLWLLVLAKVFIPPSFGAPWSIGHWTGGLQVVTHQIKVAPWPSQISVPGNGVSSIVGQGVQSTSWSGRQLPSIPAVLAMIWAAGFLIFWVAVLWRYSRVAQLARCGLAADEGPASVTLQQAALDLQLDRAPDLLLTSQITSPFLFGTVRPRIVLPSRVFTDLTEPQLRAVLAHELVHFKRRDTWIGWLQVIAQSVFWFHPFIWWSNRQLRHERECACDEMVLRLGQIDPSSYAHCIVQVLTAARGKSVAGGSLVGVFEQGTKLQNRLEEIMNFEPAKRKFGWPSRLALLVVAALFLPMAPGIVRSSAAQTPVQDEAAAAASPYPIIVKSVPAMGDTNVDPALDQISVTFDRDMRKGMSWTGGPPLFPPVDDTRPAHWIDSRTCVLPVKLEKATYYRVGINAQSFRNFQNTHGVAAACTAICFVTQGAPPLVQARVRVPKAVSFGPENGAKDVDPKIQFVSASFDVPMGRGMSWCNGDGEFPKSPEGKRATWTNDGVTCRLPVILEPGHSYTLYLNSTYFNNFQSQWGVPLQPVVYKFQTKSANQ
jgi:beta-lactamase regulating signal transducer with metallopeptidase domain